MSETTTAPTKAAEKAIKAVTTASQTLPFAETTEVALEIPTKVFLNQKLIVIVSVAGGAAAGVAGLWATKKIREKLAVRKLKADIDETEKAAEES